MRRTERRHYRFVLILVALTAHTFAICSGEALWLILNLRPNAKAPVAGGFG